MDKSDGFIAGGAASYVAVLAADIGPIISSVLGIVMIIYTLGKALNQFVDYRKKLREMDK